MAVVSPSAIPLALALALDELICRYSAFIDRMTRPSLFAEPLHLVLRLDSRGAAPVRGVKRTFRRQMMSKCCI
jgi:hypothetical protein